MQMVIFCTVPRVSVGILCYILFMYRDTCTVAKRICLYDLVKSNIIRFTRLNIYSFSYSRSKLRVEFVVVIFGPTAFHLLQRLRGLALNFVWILYFISFVAICEAHVESRESEWWFFLKFNPFIAICEAHFAGGPSNDCFIFYFLRCDLRAAFEFPFFHFFFHLPAQLFFNLDFSYGPFCGILVV